MNKNGTIKTSQGEIPILSQSIQFVCQGIAFDVETLYTNMLCMCGGHYNDAFNSFEKRRIDEVIYLFMQWKKLHEKQEKPKINLEQTYEPLAKKSTD